MRKLYALMLATALVRPSVASQRSPTDLIIYSVAFDVVDKRLEALEVRVQIPTLEGKIEGIQIPAGRLGQSFRESVRVSGGNLVPGNDDSKVVYVHANAPTLAISYRLPSEQASSLLADGQAAVIRRDWFAVQGTDILVVPLGLTDSQAVINLASLPPGWTGSSAIDHPEPLHDTVDKFLVGGAQYKVIEENVDGAPVKLFYPAAAAEQAGRILKRASTILQAERRFWRERASTFEIGLVALSDDDDFSGRGFQGGFSLYLGEHVPEKTWLRLVAHENLHTWISRKLGGFPREDDDLEAWLNEGFTEAYTARMLLQARLWSMDDFVADWNVSLARYGTSPVATVPNARMQADRQRDFDVNRLPYDRGRILAVIWDNELRRKTHRRISLDEVLRAQVRAASEDSAKGIVASADVRFPIMVKAMTGVDLEPQLIRYVDNGGRLTLRSGTFGPCAVVTRLTQPTFDRGFDLQATLGANRHVTGLEPGGPAERAGLRAGDRISIDEIPSHDSRTLLSYRVSSDNGQTRVVRYRPEGSTQITFQQLALTPLARSHPVSCRRSLSRP